MATKPQSQKNVNCLVRARKYAWGMGKGGWRAFAAIQQFSLRLREKYRV
jgi:hypothetical protein